MPIKIDIFFDKYAFPARPLCVLVCMTLLSGCLWQTPNSRPFNIKNIAKSDINLVADIHLELATEILTTLAHELYRLNPQELNKAPADTSVESRIRSITSSPRKIHFPELYFRYSVDAIPLVFDPEFEGDRVFALLVGISGMLHMSYDFKNEIFMFDQLDQQKLYDCARNIEITLWRLNNRLNINNQPFLHIENNHNDPSKHPDIEYLLGKLVSTQDIMARVVADKTNRTINLLVVSVARAALMPLAFTVTP